MPERPTTDFLNGVPELMILRILSQRPMYGYQLVQAIRVATGQRLEFGEGCVYPLLHKLKRGGLLSSSRQHVGGRTRVVYRVTAAGGRKLNQSISRWQTISLAIGSVLHGGEHESLAS